MRALMLVTCVLAASACDESLAGPGKPVNRDVVLAPGGSAVIAEAALSVRFLGVPSDSRCPATAICVTAGDATVTIDVTPPSGGRSQYDLRLFAGNTIVHGDVSIALTRLEPYPLTANPIPQGDYRATLRLTRP